MTDRMRPISTSCDKFADIIKLRKKVLAHHSKGQSSVVGKTQRQGHAFGVRKQNEIILFTFTFLFSPGHVDLCGMVPFSFSMSLLR